MKQSEIKGLVEEAANPGCSSERRNDILCRFCDATSALGVDGVYVIEGREAGLLFVMETIYTDTILNRPELLLTLFPVFALICGDRLEGRIWADVEWSLI